MLSDNKQSYIFDKDVCDMTSGELIKYKRLSVFKLSQEEFADKFNVPVGTLRNWEQGSNEPPMYFLKFVESEEKHHKNIYRTPIEEKRQQADDAISMSDGRALMREFALDKLYSNKQQSYVYELLESVIGNNGILENLQNVSPMYDDISISDAIGIAQLLLLVQINEKLEKLL